MKDYSIEITDRQSRTGIDFDRMRQAAAVVLDDAGIESAEISLAIVDDPEMHDLNRQFLNHDYPTDVLSFLLSDDKAEPLEGEIVVSSDTAFREGRRHGLDLQSELLLYVVHGMLHLVGYDDKDETSRRIMRQQETVLLDRLGVNTPLKVDSTH